MEVPGKQYTSDFCETCQRKGKTTEADGFCQQCEENICNKCVESHMKLKPNINHVMIFSNEGERKGRQAGRKKLICPKHANEKRKYYCRQHNSVACGDCIVEEHHGCKMEYITTCSKKFNESPEFTKLVEKIKHLQSMNKETDDHRHCSHAENMSITEKCINDIRKFRKEINDYLDNTETEMVAEAKRMSKENEDILFQVGKTVEEANSSINMLEGLFDVNMYTNDILFISFKESKACVEEVEKSVRETKSRNAIQSFMFVPEPRLQELIQLNKKLGRIRIDNVENVQQLGTDVPSVYNTSRSKLVERGTQTERKVTFAAVQTDTSATPVYTRTTRTTAVYSPQGDIRKPKLLERTTQAERKTTDAAVQTDTNATQVHSSSTRTTQGYSPLGHDPRSEGIDVGKRVRNIDTLSNFWGLTGTVTSVDSEGYVCVRWDSGGSSSAICAGWGGQFRVKLI